MLVLIQDFQYFAAYYILKQECLQQSLRKRKNQRSYVSKLVQFKVWLGKHNWTVRNSTIKMSGLGSAFTTPPLIITSILH